MGREIAPAMATDRIVVFDRASIRPRLMKQGALVDSGQIIRRTIPGT